MSNSLSAPETWVDQYGDYLYRYALGRVRDPHAAENVVQETFLAALSARERFTGKAKERTWLTGILKHKIIDHFRKDGRQSVVSELQDDQLTIDSFFDRHGHFKNNPGEWNLNPKEVMEKAEFWEAFQECLSKLPAMTAQVFAMRMVDKVDSKTICKEMNISSTNLWVMLHRARIQLRACLEKSWFIKE